jgi:hypothetical protein
VSSIFDPIVATVVLVVMFIMLVAGYSVYAQISTTSLVSANMKSNGDGFYRALNITMTLFVLVMALSTVVAAYLVPTSPVYAVVGVLLLFINTIVVPPLINMLNSFIQTPGMQTYAEAGFGSAIQVLQYLPVLTVVCSMLALVAGLWVSKQ